jgi:hypothetical protein
VSQRFHGEGIIVARDNDLHAREHVPCELCHALLRQPDFSAEMNKCEFSDLAALEKCEEIPWLEMGQFADEQVQGFPEKGREILR